MRAAEKKLIINELRPKVRNIELTSLIQLRIPLLLHNSFVQLGTYAFNSQMRLLYSSGAQLKILVFLVSVRIAKRVSTKCACCVCVCSWWRRRMCVQFSPTTSGTSCSSSQTARRCMCGGVCVCTRVCERIQKW